MLDINTIIADAQRNVAAQQRAEQLQELKDAVDEYSGRYGGLRDLYDWQWEEDPQGMLDAMPADTRESIGTDAVEAAADDEEHRWDHRREAM